MSKHYICNAHIGGIAQWLCLLVFPVTYGRRKEAYQELCLKLAVILCEQHRIPREVATLITQTYLRKFRLCPDNPEVNLDKWRCMLWVNALGEQYASLAKEVYLQWLQLRYQYLALTPEVISLLQKLHRHYLLGLITNGPSAAQWEKIQRLDLQRYFDCVLVSGDLPWEKPHEEIFLKACKFLSVEPSSCIMVGDKLETDILGGKEAHLGGTVWIPLNKDPPPLSEDDPCPDYTLEKVTDLPCLLPTNPKRPMFVRSGPGSVSAFPRSFDRTMPDLEDCNSNSSDGS